MDEKGIIPPLTLKLKQYGRTGIFYIPTFLIQQNCLTVNKRYKLIILEEVG